MTIILQNVDKTIGQIGLVNSNILGQFYIDECIGLFVDWVDTKSNNVDLLIQQTEIIENFIKSGKKIVIFDRYCSITSDEFRYLSKHNVDFWEPRIFTRKGFHYQPCWVDAPDSVDDVDWVFDKNKKYDVGYKGSIYNKLYTQSKKYTNEWFDDTSLVKRDIEIGNLKIDEYKLFLLLGTPDDYSSGFIDPIFVDCIKEGVIPILPKEHRWYHAIFQGLVIQNEIEDIKHCVNLSDSASFGMVYGILRNIKKYHTEMTSKYVMERIFKHFNKI